MCLQWNAPSVIEDELSQESIEEDSQDSAEAECQLCEAGGLLVLCDTCNGGFHLHCIGLTEVPEGMSYLLLTMSSSGVNVKYSKCAST